MNDYSNDTQSGIPTDGDQPSYGKNRNNIWAGLFVLAVGGVLLLREAGVFFPEWLFTWPMIIIAAGLLGGIKHKFRPGGWMIALSVGGIFLADNINPGASIHKIAWPLLIMLIGLMMIVRPKNSRGFHQCKGRHRNRWRKEDRVADFPVDRDSSDFIDATTVFGGVKKIVLSKDFKGGDVVNFMGGTEINLTQADITGRINIDATNVFGGTKLIVPPTWDVQSDVLTIFGGVEDKRQMTTEVLDRSKIIHLSGTCLFGGIEIKSY